MTETGRPESNRYDGPIIDAHVHLFPPEVVADRRGFLERDAWFGALFENPPGGMVSVDDLLQSMNRARIERSVIAAWPWRDEGHCRLHNQFLAEICVEHPDRLSWLCIVNPSDPAAVRDVEWSVAHGAAGVGELNADAQGFDWLDDDDWSVVTTWCAEHEIPVLLHASEPLGHSYPGKGTATPERLIHMIAACPELSIVAAHWGGGLPFYELMPEVAAVTGNVVYDSAASTFLYRAQVFDMVRKLAGPDRILFGSDYPVLRPDRLLRTVELLEIDDSSLHAMLSSNACHVYGLDGKATAR